VEEVLVEPDLMVITQDLVVVLEDTEPEYVDQQHYKQQL
tara:strand:+ start:78 stop:194 length:117 start_codon:yes stop_codon:yes gene_type:complete